MKHFNINSKRIVSYLIYCVHIAIWIAINSTLIFKEIPMICRIDVLLSNLMNMTNLSSVFGSLLLLCALYAGSFKLMYHLFRCIYFCATVKVGHTTLDMIKFGERGKEVVDYLSRKSNDSSTMDETAELTEFDDWDRCDECKRYVYLFNRHEYLQCFC